MLLAAGRLARGSTWTGVNCISQYAIPSTLRAIWGGANLYLYNLTLTGTVPVQVGALYVCDGVWVGVCVRARAHVCARARACAL